MLLPNPVPFFISGTNFQVRSLFCLNAYMKIFRMAAHILIKFETEKSYNNKKQELVPYQFQLRSLNDHST